MIFPHDMALEIQALTKTPNKQDVYLRHNRFGVAQKRSTPILTFLLEPGEHLGGQEL